MNDKEIKFIMYYIETYSIEKIIDLIEKKGINLQVFLNDNAEKLYNVINSNLENEEFQEKMINLFGEINYQFKEDDILYYIKEDSNYDFNYCNKTLNYIINNGTNLNYKKNKESETLIEKIFKNYLTHKNVGFNYLYTLKVIDSSIRNGKWDLSVKDINNRDSIDYLHSILNKSFYLEKNRIIEKYKSLLCGEQNHGVLINKKKFLKK